LSTARRAVKGEKNGRNRPAREHKESPRKGGLRLV
jgi:hypothetical protein